MSKVQKHQSAANNIKSPTWEKASITIEECSRRIRAICTYCGVPASHLPSKKELAEIKKAKELQEKLRPKLQRLWLKLPPQPCLTIYHHNGGNS
ncbi:hypothetical protein CDAR_168131 [Caerostris darwini]|uniref:Uncharacterized protein n=1 Tax=Caerostris darwini TaxID=1538125 RepID=A0AAV4T3S8_9ARAC|nr:hypothetical protein CDAR_168131 [Caerostris darwini]